MPQVFAVQFDIVWEDKAANHATVERLLAEVAIPSGSLIVLPEMFDVGFSLNAAEMSEEATGGASEQWCAELARRLGVFVQGASIRQSDPGSKATNNAVVFNPTGELICRYEKIHPFSGGRESERYRGGNRIVTYEWQEFTVCPFVCYDLRFPEIWRLASLEHGANLFAIGANWPTVRQHHWLTLLDARAIENQAYVVGVNRCGQDPHLAYSGGSKIIDPKGRPLASADDAPTVLVAEVELEIVNRWRERFAALRDAHREYFNPDARRLKRSNF